MIYSLAIHYIINLFICNAESTNHNHHPATNVPPHSGIGLPLPWHYTRQRIPMWRSTCQAGHFAHKCTLHAFQRRTNITTRLGEEHCVRWHDPKVGQVYERRPRPSHQLECKPPCRQACRCVGTALREQCGSILYKCIYTPLII